MAVNVNGDVYQERTRKRGDSYMNIDELNTEEQRGRGRYFSEKYFERRAELDSLIIELGWDELEKAFACRRDNDTDDESAPCNFIPLITPCIEGQTAHMSSSELEHIFYSDNPAHEDYMDQVTAGFEYIKRASQYTMQFKDVIRYYLLLGNTWLSAKWTTSYGRRGKKPGGVPKVYSIHPRDVMVDGRIKDSKDLQDAEYIIHEIGFVPIAWARDEYGDDMAEALQSSTSTSNSPVQSDSIEDYDSFKLLHVWTRNNPSGNLQLIEMDEGGLILRESDHTKPYYSEVDNEYPFYFIKMAPLPGCFYGFGDGQILYHMQEIVNKLCDEMELAARYSAQAKYLVDPRSKMDPVLFDSDPSHIIPCINPNQNVRAMETKGMNEVVYQMINFILREAQRATRYSDSMNGQAGAASRTATSVQSEMMQGNVGIQDKKEDIIGGHRWAALYCIKIAMERWEEPFWSSKGKGKPMMVDMAQMKSLPGAMEVSPETTARFMDANPNFTSAQIPKFEPVPGSTSSLDVDCEVSLGTGMPHGTLDVFNILQNLVMQTPINAQGMPEPVLSLKRYREEVEKRIGINLTEMDDISPIAGILTPVPQPGQAPAAPAVNPVGASGQVQAMQGNMMPPPNLRGTVPGLNGSDKRMLAGGTSL